MFSKEGCILVPKCYCYWPSSVCTDVVFPVCLIQSNRIVNTFLLKVQKPVGFLWITQELSPQTPSGALLSLHLLEQQQVLRRQLTLHFLGLDTTCKSDRSAGESCLHLQLRVLLELHEVLGRRYRERDRSLSKHSLSLRIGSSQWFLCLTFLFPKCTRVHTEFVSQPLWNRAVEVLQDMTLSQTNLGTDLIQSSETVLSHNCQQIAFTWWTVRGQHTRFLPLVSSYGIQRRHRGTFCTKEFLFRKASSP